MYTFVHLSYVLPKMVLFSLLFTLFVDEKIRKSQRRRKKHRNSKKDVNQEIIFDFNLNEFLEEEGEVSSHPGCIYDMENIFF